MLIVHIVSWIKVDRFSDGRKLVFSNSVLDDMPQGTEIEYGET